MAAPAESRTSSAAPAAQLRRGLGSLYDVLTGPNASVARTWAGQPMTQIVAAALADLALSPPPVSGSSEILVQYGVSQGLALARRMLTDPEAFAPQRGEPDMPDDSYEQPLDSL